MSPTHKPGAPSAASETDARTQRVLQFYQSLTPQSVAQIDHVYDEQARFVDPFNDVQGAAAVRQIFTHMFANLDEPRFEVHSALTGGDTCLLLWTFHCRRQGRPQALSLQGMSHLRYGADGRVALHQDHWDPSRQIYERLPLLGALLRWLRRRLSAGASR